MGVDPFTATLMAVSTATGLIGQNRAHQQAKQQRSDVMGAPQRALDFSQKILDQYGQPQFGEAQFYGVGPEGAQAKSQALFNQQMSLLQPKLDDEKRAIEQRMLAQGMPSSLVTEALRAVEEKYALAAQQASFMGTAAGTDLASQEAARHTAFSQQQATNQFQESAYAPSLAAGLVGGFSSNAVNAGQLAQNSLNQQQSSLAGVGAGMGGLYNSYNQNQIANKYLDQLGNTTPSSGFVDQPYQPIFKGIGE